jgi:hypothetical protein
MMCYRHPPDCSLPAIRDNPTLDMLAAALRPLNQSHPRWREASLVVRQARKGGRPSSWRFVQRLWFQFFENMLFERMCAGNQ